MKNLVKMLSLIILIQGCASGQYSSTTRVRVLDKRIYAPIDSKAYEVEDKNAAITYSPDIVESGLNFQFKNKTDKPIKIIWDESAYIGPDAKSQKIFHNGVKIIERSNTQPPTLVPPMSLVDDSLTPINSADWDSNLGGWIFSPLCGTRSIYTHELDDKNCLNQTFSFFITYEIENKKNSLLLKYKFVSKEPVLKK